MCGRFTSGKWSELYAVQRGFLDSIAEMQADDPGETERYNIKPTQQIAFVHADKDGLHLAQARWWFVPHWFKGEASEWKATTFNAKIETAFEKPTLRDAWQRGRCLIPATGYYEWTGEPGKKQPWYVTPQSNEPGFFFAGLWSRLRDGTASCAILTRPAADEICDLHPRMPVMLKGDEIARWMRHERPHQEDIATLGTQWHFRAHKVKRFGIKDDGPELVAPWEG